jgi:GLPGLI family protein
MLAGLFSNGQQMEGKVTYQRISTFEAHFNMNGEEQVIPQTRKENFELLFGNNHSLWQAAEENNDNMETTDAGGGMQIRMFVAGSNDVLYTELDTKKKTEKREMFDKSFIIDDSVKALSWKITGETKTVLNHNCMKAVATNIRQSTRMTMDNGKMERQEVTDTVAIVAWFTNEIPVSAGPAEYQAQLPGLILELDVNKGRQTYVATSISPKADLASIKEPTGKKHYTPAEFKKESDKMMKEMQENMGGGGGGRTIRIGN